MNARIRIGSMVAVAGLCVGAAGWFWLRTSAQRLHVLPPSTPLETSKQPPAPQPGEALPPALPKDIASTLGKSAADGASASEQPAIAPLRPGETLEYTAHISKVSNVASLSLVVRQQKSFFGRAAWHLQAFAHTQNPLRMIFALDDQFDSYSDAASLTSLQYELHLNEHGAKVDRVLRMTTGHEPAPRNATAARVLPGTRDPIGMIQFLRNVDWTKTPLVRCPVFDGQKLYDVQARLSDSDVSITVPAGVFTASRIEVRVFQNGTELKDTHFALNLANNEARTPVLLEAFMPFADARVELTRVQ